MLLFVVECRVHRRIGILGGVIDICCRDDLVNVTGLGEGEDVCFFHNVNAQEALQVV